MLFNSIEFLVFFPIVALVYFSMPYARRWALLLVASYIFYAAWNPLYLLLIFVSTLVDYVAALKMGQTSKQSQKRLWLALSLCVNLGLLFSFKYVNFAGEVLRELLGLGGLDIQIPYADVLLPVGISFYTFQTLSYTIEVYRGNQEPEKSLGRFALYVSFFPQLVAGPIERPKNLLPQLKCQFDFDYDGIVAGLRLILWGMFKKVVIADRLAVVVNAVYLEPERYPGSILVLATIFFAFQIYCDFSGYTDIARGCARVLGIDLMKNFNRPYFATSIADFWRRWHISLSTWFRDYVYLPLGGSKGTTAKWILALVATFGLSGLWHGANWTFIVWGLLHVTYYGIGKASLGVREKLSARIGLASIPRVHHGIQILLTLTLVCFGWIFFRADSMGSAWYIVTHLGDRFFDFSLNSGFREIVASWDISIRAFQLNIALIVFLLMAERYSGKISVSDRIGAWSTFLRWSAYVALCMSIMNLGVTNEIPFVYFQF